MLNELYELSQSLSRLGIDVVSWHRFLKECPRGGKSYFADLDAESNVTSLRPITDPDRLSQLRKYEKAAGYSFPSFNVLPLWQFDGENNAETATKLRKAITSTNPPRVDEVVTTLNKLVGTARSVWIDPSKKTGGRDAMDKLNGCTGAVVRDLLKIVPESSDCKAFRKLLERTVTLDGVALHAQLNDWLVHQFHVHSDRWSVWFDMLFFLKGSKPKAFSLILELSDQSDFDFPVNHQRSYEAFNRCLQGVEVSDESAAPPLKPDAYAATDGGRDDSFPEVKMSRFGKINLRAMSRESLCQIRYGVAESKSFPVSKSIRQECKNALEWISRDERQGLTWSDISSVSGAPAILFAYPVKLSKHPPSLTSWIVSCEESSSLENEGSFEAISQTIATALQGRISTHRENDIVVFVLTKPDGFRTKVLFSHRYSSKRIIDAAKDWELGAFNIPNIQLRQFGEEKGSKPRWRDPITPFTLEVIGCLNTVWQRGGTHASACKTIRVADALSLLLDKGQAAENTAHHLLEILLKNTTGLLIAAGQASQIGQVHVVQKNLQKQQLLLPRILGILLHKLDIHKGDFMKTPSFLVGRMLSLADQLHLQYCNQVRKKEVPPQLVGNSLMPTALHTPIQALSVLADRVRPYQAWAQTVQSGENIGLAKYLLSQLSTVSMELANCEIPTRTNDADRATMLLGYLSRPEKETAETGANDDDNSN